eukprot:5098784-Alexandrium_andersonii.AAC.1
MRLFVQLPIRAGIYDAGTTREHLLLGQCVRVYIAKACVSQVRGDLEGVRFAVSDSAHVDPTLRGQ